MKARQPPRGRSTRMIPATRLAAFCEVDLKTVHNWTNRGKIPGVRTRGRHLRFRRLDVVDFLRQYGFAIPEAMRQTRPRVVVIDGDARALDTIHRALSRRFEVTAFAHAVEGLLGLVALDPDILVLGDVTPLDPGDVTTRLAAAEPTRHVRVVSAGTPRAEVGELRARVEHLAGLD